MRQYKKTIGKKKSPLKVLLAIIIGIVAFVVFVLIGVKLGEKLAYITFYHNAKREFAMPGTTSGFVGQGLDYVEDEQAFLACGYASAKGEASMVYLIEKDGKQTCVKLKNADGGNYTGHTGGIAHYGEYVYITGADGCDVFKLDDFIQKKDEARKIGEIKSPAGHDPAYVTVHGGKLYEGSFYRNGNYETPENERITTPSGDKNTAVIYVYDLDEGQPFGVNQAPVAAYSTRGLVQGMTFTEDRMVLSCSYGFASSHLCFYDAANAKSGSYSVNGKDIPIYYLDGSVKVSEIALPPMSEEIVYKDGRIFIMNESASKKYIFGKFMSGRYMYSYEAD